VGSSMHDYTLQYARYYDLLTSHKDYDAEVDTLFSFLAREGFGSQSRVLSVGCGTGSHERLLASRVSQIVGIDQSSNMVACGLRKKAVPNLMLKNENISNLVEDKFDVVISLFNVVNCIREMEALSAFFAAIAAKTRNNGLLIIEVWNSFATILAPPQVVERRYNAGDVQLKRVATPFLYPHDGILRLEYHITGQDGGDSVSLQSIHNIYLHSRELLECCLRQAGFGPADWYSALSEGMNPAVNEHRMLLFCARKTESFS
jgi:SAM-dependent methyltransferase